MVVLDTNILIDILKGNEKTHSILREYADQKLSTTIFNKYELLRGSNEKTFQKINSLIASLNLYYFSDKALDESIKIYKMLEQKGNLTQEIDMLIVGVSHSNGEVLLTKDKNLKDALVEYNIRYLNSN